MAHLSAAEMNRFFSHSGKHSNSNTISVRRKKKNTQKPTKMRSWGPLFCIDFLPFLGGLSAPAHFLSTVTTDVDTRLPRDVGRKSPTAASRTGRVPATSIDTLYSFSSFLSLSFVLWLRPLVRVQAKTPRSHRERRVILRNADRG